jgi:hypothetical protein
MWAGEGDGESSTGWPCSPNCATEAWPTSSSWSARLKGLPQSVNAVFGDTIVQTCIHLIWDTFRYAGRQHRDAIAKAIKPIYTAVNAAAAKEALDTFDAEWGYRYPAAIRLWRNAWEEFIPFLDYDTEIRKGDLFDQRDRITERPLSPRDPRARPPNRQPSNAYTWSPDRSTRQGPAKSDGRCAGSQR